MTTQDARYRFIFEGSDCRGHLVKLNAAWQQIKARHNYPPQVESLLGQAVAATALMTGSVKIDGSLTLQARGEGAVPLLLVQAKANGSMRALAKWKQSEFENNLLGAFGDKAQLAVMIDPGDNKERYQGLVALEGERLQDALAAYFQQSEQIKTRFWLAADKQQVAGLFLQELPGVGEKDEDAWNRLCHLADTVKPAELLECGAEELLRRLFHQEELRLFEPENLHFVCDCSRETIANMLLSLGHKEAQETLVEQSKIEVACEFCLQTYKFDAVDIEQLFSAESIDPASDTRH